MRWSGLKDDRIYLKHILEEIQFLDRISDQKTYDDIIHDDYFSHAVRSALEVIGEASKNVSDIVKDNHQDISWREMAALRDRIIHGYFSIDYSIVWNVITKDIPEIKPKIFSLLKELDKQYPDSHF
jgi:uncharacterized protein with HEPN domain